MNDSFQPKLKFLHDEQSLINSKLLQYSKLSDEELTLSLLPGKEGSLKTRDDGTVVDGHHRLQVLLNRGVNINALPRDIIQKHGD